MLWEKERDGCLFISVCQNCSVLSDRGPIIVPIQQPSPPRRGANVEDAFLETAKQIFQNIQDGSLDLNAAETGVQQRDVSNGKQGVASSTSFCHLPSVHEERHTTAHGIFVFLTRPPFPAHLRLVPLGDRPQPKDGCC
jgi:hypothetical protein